MLKSIWTLLLLRLSQIRYCLKLSKLIEFDMRAYKINIWILNLRASPTVLHSSIFRAKTEKTFSNISPSQDGEREAVFGCVGFVCGSSRLYTLAFSSHHPRSVIGGWYIGRCIGRPLDLCALSRHMEIKFDNWHTWTWSSIYAENNKSKMPKHALRWVHGFDGRGLNLGGAGRVATGVPASWPPSRASAGQGSSIQQQRRHVKRHRPLLVVDKRGSIGTPFSRHACRIFYQYDFLVINK
jgi:hypothetical protein